MTKRSATAPGQIPLLEPEVPQKPVARYVKPGEMLAMDPAKIRRGPHGFFWLFGGGVKRSERVKDDVTVVHIRDELEHHDSGWGDSYEGILSRLKKAITGQDIADQHEREHRWDDDYKPIAATPPKTIIVCIDSPGGVVAGLNETVRSIRQMIKANPGVQFCAFVNELCASAAYAIATAFPEIYCPPSAIVGSIGVISTMISQARKNKRDGYDVILITSGKRKADGHLHAPISQDAVDAERGRVEKLAMSFFKLASKARGIPIEKVRSFEAAIYLGDDAVKRRLADALMSFDDVLLGATDTEEPDAPRQSGGNQTDRRVKTKEVFAHAPSTEAAMPIQLDALIKKTEKAVAAEKDPKKLAALMANLDAYKKTKHTIEKHESEEDDGDDEGDEDDDTDDSDKDDEDEESEETMPEKDGGDEDEEDDEEDEEEESEEKSAKAALALVQSITGMKGKKALGALQALAATAANIAKDVAALKKQNRGAAKQALIDGAKGKFLTRKEAAWLSGQRLATVKGFVEMRRKSGVIVHTDETTILRPKQTQPGTEESLPQETRDMIEIAVAGFPGDETAKKSFRETLVKNHLAAHNETINRALNGAPGRI
jgi:ClpP class serine protease